MRGGIGLIAVVPGSEWLVTDSGYYYWAGYEVKVIEVVHPWFRGSYADVMLRHPSWSRDNFARHRIPLDHRWGVGLVPKP